VQSDDRGQYCGAPREVVGIVYVGSHAFSS
jgi:hypothetical protein